MKKLTNKQMRELLQKTAEGIDASNIVTTHWPIVAKAVQAEVLRINGLDRQTMTPAELVQRVRGGEEWMVDMAQLRHDALLPECLPPDTPRATGCPDTMDETAEIAVALKQAGEEKSPLTTRIAG